MHRLYGTPTSPYTRIARIAAAEFGYEYEFCGLRWRVSPAELFEINPVRRVPAHSIHGLRLGLASPAKGTRLDLELDNLGNEQYADEYGCPVPGRAIYMTISMDSPARP